MGLSALLPLQHLTQGRDLDLKIVFFDRHSRPNLAEKLVLADDGSPGESEYPQGLRRAGSDPHRRAAARELAIDRIKPELAEVELFAAHRGPQVAKVSGNLRS